jgi:hypothetical protein
MKQIQDNAEVDDLLRAYTPEVRDLALAIRQQIHNMLPYIAEKVYPGWKVILCSVDGTMKRGICAISPQRQYVNLIFYRGADIDDPDGILEGDGKKVRHIKITDAARMQRPEIEHLIKTAAGLAEQPGTV